MIKKFSKKVFKYSKWFMANWILFFTFYPFFVIASDENNKEVSNERFQCHHTFFPDLKVDVVSSGRDADQIEAYTKLLTSFYEKGGVADRLGLAKPPHQAVFAPSAQLAMLATLGRHAVPHWLDGAELIHAYRSAGVMEFVTPGCPTCRSFYSDTTTPIHQNSVIMHVFGHNHFAAHAYANLLRNTDPIAESVYLGQEITKARTIADRGEVDFWYQILGSFTMLQDIFTGSFETPESLEIKPRYDENGKKKPTIQYPTPAILQALVKNLPPTAPTWKKEMTQHFERMNRVYGYYANNKILNEGFAVMCQLILPKYTGHNSSEEIIEYASLLRAVVGSSINLSNPYWLGVEAWKNYYLDLREKPENANLTLEDFTVLFIAKVTEIIHAYSDYDGLKLLLNERFVERYKLFLKKEVHPQQYDWNLPRDNPNHNAQFQVASKDAKEVIHYLVDQYANRRLRTPEIHLTSLDVQAGQSILLRFQPFREKALHFKNAVLTAYVLAIAFERKIILEGDFYTNRRKNSYRIEVTGDTEVSPVRVWSLSPDWSQKNVGDVKNLGTLDSYTIIARKYIQEFRDTNYGFNGAEVEEQLDRFIPFASVIVEDNIQNISKLLSHAPETAAAIKEYVDKVRTSLPRRLHGLMSGTLKARNVGQGVALKVLPDIPTFTYDTRWDKQYALEKKQREWWKHIEDMRLSQLAKIAANTPSKESSDDENDVSLLFANDLGRGDGRVGDKYWGKRPPDDPPGPGEGDGDDIEGGRDPMDRGGPKPGDSSSINPNEVFIGFDRLVEMMDLELPNRKKRKQTEIETNDTMLEGGVRKPNGEELWLRMMPEIFVNGKLSLEKKAKENGEDPKEKTFTLRDQFQEGLRYLKDEDIIVRDREPTKVPDTKAVFVRVMDVSGSMMGEPQEIAMRFYKTMEVLLRKKYKTLKIINVGFDTEAHIMSDEDFFKVTMGGGTLYTAGLEKAHEISTQAEFQNYDKYMVLAGDFGMGMEPEFEPTIAKLWEELNWGGMVFTDPTGNGWANQTYIEMMKQIEQQNEWFSYGKIASDLPSHLEVLKHFFGKKKVSQK